MSVKLKRVGEQVIVITGASSGIGLATAEMAAEAGACVVLSSRHEMELRKAVDRIRIRGGRAVYVVADVADADAVQEIANRAIEEFGSFDTWVNNAGISIYGRTTEVPLEDKRRLFDVNFWGVVHGCRAAVPHLRRRGGAIINIGSIVSDRAVPLQGVYTGCQSPCRWSSRLRSTHRSSGTRARTWRPSPSFHRRSIRLRKWRVRFCAVRRSRRVISRWAAAGR